VCGSTGQRTPKYIGGKGYAGPTEGSGLLALQQVRTLGRVGELVGVDRMGAVEPREGVRLPAGRLQRVGVRVAQSHRPGRTALGVERSELERAQRGVQLTHVAS